MSQRCKEAQEIFGCHLAANASDPVNVDSFAHQETQRGLQGAAPQLFDAAQRQVHPQAVYIDLHLNH